MIGLCSVNENICIHLHWQVHLILLDGWIKSYILEKQNNLSLSSMTFLFSRLNKFATILTFFIHSPF